MADLTNLQQITIDIISKIPNKPVDIKDIINGLGDPGRSYGTIRTLVHGINVKIRPNGYEIVSRTLNRKTHYQLVRRLASPYNGRT